MFQTSGNTHIILEEYLGYTEFSKGKLKDHTTCDRLDLETQEEFDRLCPEISPDITPEGLQWGVFKTQSPAFAPRFLSERAYIWNGLCNKFVGFVPKINGDEITSQPYPSANSRNCLESWEGIGIWSWSRGTAALSFPPAACPPFIISRWASIQSRTKCNPVPWL